MFGEFSDGGSWQDRGDEDRIGDLLQEGLGRRSFEGILEEDDRMSLLLRLGADRGREQSWEDRDEDGTRGVTEEVFGEGSFGDGRRRVLSLRLWEGLGFEGLGFPRTMRATHRDHHGGQ